MPSSSTGKGKEGAGGKGGGAAGGMFEVYSPLFDPVTGETLFCICRRANDGEAMICCDVCEEWYHLRCIGLSTQEAARLDHFKCQRCHIDPARGRDENRKRKRAEDDRKSKPTTASQHTEKRVRRRDKNGVVGGDRDGGGDDDDMGDGTGKWITKDAGVESESDDDDLVYMTSDDEDVHPPPSTVKVEVKLEGVKGEVKVEGMVEAGLALPSPLEPAETVSSFRPHHVKVPRTQLHLPSFARPDHRLHPLIHHTARFPPPLYPPSLLLQRLSRQTTAALHQLYHHPYYTQAHTEERCLLPNRLLDAVQRLTGRWSSLQGEYEAEEEKRQLQLSGEEWRLQQLILAYHVPASAALTPDDDSFAPQPSALDLLLSSALPIGLGHPRFIRDTQAAVTSANDFASSIEAFHSHPHTPSSSQSAAPTPHAARTGFRFAAQKKQAADCVCIESVYCIGCEGYIPVGDFAAHLEDCSLGPMTTPDQRLTVVLPYEEAMEDEVRPSVLITRQWTDEDEQVQAATIQSSQAALTLQQDKVHGLEPSHVLPKPAPSPPQKNGTLLPHPPVIDLTDGPVTTTHSPVPPPPSSSLIPLPPLPPMPAADRPVPPPALSAVPSPPVVTRFYRFLNPSLFPTLMCGYPLLCGPESAPSHTHCREMREQCPDHLGWEERWRADRRRRRGELVGRLVALRDDMDALNELLTRSERRLRSRTLAEPHLRTPLLNGRDVAEELSGGQ